MASDEALNHGVYSQYTQALNGLFYEKSALLGKGYGILDTIHFESSDRPHWLKRPSTIVLDRLL